MPCLTACPCLCETVCLCACLCAYSNRSSCQTQALGSTCCRPLVHCDMVLQPLTTARTQCMHELERLSGQRIACCWEKAASIDLLRPRWDMLFISMPYCMVRETAAASRGKHTASKSTGNSSTPSSNATNSSRSCIGMHQALQPPTQATDPGSLLHREAEGPNPTTAQAGAAATMNAAKHPDKC